MALGRLWTCGRLVQPRRARPLHVSAVRFALAPTEHLRAIATPVTASELAHNISPKLLSRLPHPGQLAWAEVTSVGAAKEFAPRIG